MKLTIIIITYTVIVLAVMALLYRPLRRILDPDRKHPVRMALPIMAAVIMASFTVVGALTPNGPLCWFFQRWGNIILGYFIYFFGTLFILVLCLEVYGAVHKARHGGKWQQGRSHAGIILVISLIVTVALNIAGWNVAHDVKVTGYQLPMDTLGLKEPLRIVLVGDLHIGVNSSLSLYQDMVARINEQDADLVLIAGDLINSSFGAMEDPDAYASIFSEIRSKYGSYAIYGNHDVDEPLFGGFTYIDKEEALRNPAMEGWVKACGWQILEDEVVEVPGIDGMLLAGRRDEAKPGDGIDERQSLEELLQGLDSDNKVLLLQHEPTDLKKLDEAGVALSLSGHTHDGQIFPGNLYCRLFTEQSYGLKDWGSSKAIVTSGVGYYGPPIRVGTISEIVVIDFI